LLGATYQESVTKLNVRYLGARAHPRREGRWAEAPRTRRPIGKTASTHLRADDLGDGNVAVILEERNTLGNLAQLRANKEVDPLAMDPSIAAITRSGSISDPNAARGRDAGRH
jgi:hypothetical protein